MRLWWLGVLALAGCSHEFELARPTAVATPPVVRGTAGHTHQPYAGKPKYLAATRPMLPTAEPTAGARNPCQTRAPGCDDRLRAVLAAVDGHLLSLETPPTDVQLQATRLTLLELTPLLAPYPDMASERDELRQLLEQLPSLSVVDQLQAHKRMAELTDLIRVQLAAAQ